MTHVDVTLAKIDAALAAEGLARVAAAGQTLGDAPLDRPAAGTARLLAALDEETPRPTLPRTWCLWILPTYRWPIVPDYTSHSRGWPYVCQHRGILPAGDDATVTLVCTRSAHHTGRHAHGSGAIVEAVWEDA